MIGRLRGSYIAKKNNVVIIDVSGVGYEVEMPLTDVCEIHRVGDTYTLHTHFVVREDAQLIFGFVKEETRDMFRLLIKVNGVGGKVALAILSGMSVQDLVFCFQHEDIARLTKIPGIGKKTAERLMIEMRDKLAAWISGDGVSFNSDLLSSGSNIVAPAAEAQNALVALGYKAIEAEKAVKRVGGSDLTVEQIIREALRGMVKN